MRKNILKMTNKDLSLPQWFSGEGPNADVVISTRIRLARNIVRHRFPNKASLLERKRVYTHVLEAIDKIQACKDYVSFNFLGMPRLYQEYLVELRIASPDLLIMDGERGVACDPLRRINIMINEEDHLRIQCMDPGFTPRLTWDTLNTIDDSLGKEIAYSFDFKRGFLTSCPTNAGTGMRVSFLLHLPGLVLTKNIDQVLQGASQMGVLIRGFFGEHSQVIGHLFQLSNQATMGARELDFVDNTQTVISRIMDLERLAREKVMKHAKTELSDKIHRSFGILSNAVMLDINEFMNLSSSLRLGIQTGLYKGLSIGRLNLITMAILPAHLAHSAGNELDNEVRNRVRADVVRAMLCEESKLPPRKKQTSK